jgi:hypothetical protein
MAEAERGYHDRQRGEVEQQGREHGSGRDRCAQQRGRRASSKSDQYDLYHRELSRFISG